MKVTINNLKISLDQFSKRGKWQNQFVNVINSDIFWVIIACYLIRLLFYLNLANTDGWFPDSKSYLNYKANIFLGQVDYFRTPVYPYFIKLIKLLGEEHLLRNVKIAQSVISFIMIIVFYKTINIVFQNKKVIILATIVFSIAPTISNFDVCLITESLSINAVVLFLYFIISFLKKPKLYKAILMTFYVFLLIMLRPSFLFLLPILFFFWLARILLLKKEWKLNTAGIVTSLICIFLIFGYSQLNFINNQCNSISAVASVNQLGNIIDYNIYENGNDPEISETIKNNLTPTGLQTDLFDNYSYSRVTKFVIGCIINQPVIYIKKTLLKIGGLSKSTTVCIMTFYKNGFMGIPDLISNVFSISFLNLYVLMFIDLLFIIYCWIKSKQVPWFKIIVWLIIGGQFATIVIGSPAEYSGLFVVVIPCVIILLFSYIDMLLNSVDKNKLREYLTSNTTSI